jgi:peptidoglycan/xylan/chitin deacetylase (PgdA/CDA1 family)
MYHRVAQEEVDPWSLCVTPDHFAQQMSVVERNTHPLRLGELVSGDRNDGASTPTVVVTFDDGYVDNLRDAKPILERYDVPATVFVERLLLGQGPCQASCNSSSKAACAHGI